MNTTPVLKRSSRGPSRFRVTDDLHGLRTVIVNCFFWGQPGVGNPWVLIDAGLPGCAADVWAFARELFGEKTAPAAVILTHAHFDHIGALDLILKTYHAPVFAHALEIPYVTGRQNYLPPDPSVGGGLMARLSPLFPNKAKDYGRSVHPLPDDGTVPFMPGWRWVFTPGHTVGHVSLFREADRLVISGDAFVSVRQESLLAVAKQRAEIRPPPAYFTTDWSGSWHSLHRLRDLRPEIAATGHGPVVSGRFLRDGLARLDADFERVGLPHHGRYVEATWKAPGPPQSQTAA